MTWKTWLKRSHASSASVSTKQIAPSTSTSGRQKYLARAVRAEQLSRLERTFVLTAVPNPVVPQDVESASVTKKKQPSKRSSPSRRTATTGQLSRSDRSMKLKHLGRIAIMLDQFSAATTVSEKLEFAKSLYQELRAECQRLESSKDDEWVYKVIAARNEAWYSVVTLGAIQLKAAESALKALIPTMSSATLQQLVEQQGKIESKS